MHLKHRISVIQALLAALFFGVSAPLAKLLLGDIDPIYLAGMLYLGSGMGTLLFRMIQKFILKESKREAPIRKKDVPWLAGAVVFGGIAAPIVLMFSLRESPAATASLLLNFEGIATTLLAALLFHEAISARVTWAVVLVTVASMVLSLDLSGGWGITLGALGVVAACVFWGVDNNLTRQISDKDPLQIVTIKGFAAGAVSCLLGYILGKPFPSVSSILLAMLLGAVSYGMSIVLFVYAMRGLGAARTSAFFGIAPFIGAALSLFLFRDNLAWPFFAGIPPMLLGAWLLVGEKHQHEHIHPTLTHEHRHSHADAHHDHTHPAEEKSELESHSHQHNHLQLKHSHSHSPDIHHRHQHKG